MLTKKDLKINYKILIVSIILGTVITFFTYNITNRIDKTEGGPIVVETKYVEEMGWPLPYYQIEVTSLYFGHSRLASNSLLALGNKIAKVLPLKKDKTPLECMVDTECIKDSLPYINWINLFVDIAFFSVISYLILSLAIKYLK